MRLSALCLLPFLSVLPASAHDFWLEPSLFRPTPGAVVTLGLRVGQNVSGDPVPRSERLLERFVVVSKGAPETPVRGFEGRDPAGFFSVSYRGLYLAGYRSRPSPVELPAEKFEKYLIDEGLEAIVAIRQKKGESGKSGKEIFSRCAKTLLMSGDEPAGPFDKELGFTLELIPKVNPYDLRGRPLALRLLFQKKPLAGALIVAMNAEDPAVRLTARTDRKGEVSLTLTTPGMWLIKAVHMIPAAPASGAEWESLWASLTFELAGKG